MFRIKIYIALAIVLLNVHYVLGQEVSDTLKVVTPLSKIELLQKQKEQVINDEKARLKREVEKITEDQSSGVLTSTEAENKKKEAAEIAAKNIENKIAILDNNIALLQRGEDLFIEEDIVKEDVLEEPNNCKYKRVYDKRTSSAIYVAFGFNHGLIDGVSFNDTPYQIGGSKFFEVGWQWKTRLLKNSNAIRLTYGISYQSNGIKAADNLYFVKVGDITSLETYEGKVHKAKLRMDNFVVPVFFEFGPSKKVEREDYFRYDTRHKFVTGIGGYAGLNSSTRQKLRATNLEGVKSEQKIKDNYNTNNFIYGIAGYIGYGGVSLYVKYDLNDMFKEPNVEQHNISLGLRFEI